MSALDSASPSAAVWVRTSGGRRLADVMEELGAIPNVRLDRYTTWRVGGPADWLLDASDYDDVSIASIIARSRGLDLTIIGNGSNLLVSDAGVRGLVIRLTGSLATITDHGDRTLYVGAGVRLPELAKYYRDAGAGGLEWGFGVPGCLGGAIYMNAGTRDGEIKDLVERVTVVGPGGAQLEISGAECSFGYRESRFQRTGELIVGALLRMLSRPFDEELSRKSLEYRKKTQPLDLPNGGSVFTNPTGEHAAALIEACGLKGTKYGDAQISVAHANFIVNLGHATAANVRDLLLLAQMKVKEKFGIELHSEVRMIGEWETGK